MAKTKPKIFAVIGEDARQVAAGEYLRRKGYVVLGAEDVYQADYVLMPMPLSADRAGFARLLRAAKPGALAFGGKVSEEARAAAQAAHIGLEDYLEREEVAQLNAVPTAEGCIALILQNRTKTIWRSPMLVLGYGRCGQALVRRLMALDAKVTVAVRDAGQRAQAVAQGCNAVSLDELNQVLPTMEVVVNTIPATVLEEEQLAMLSAASLVIDLASLPGGVDLDAANRLGVRAIRALSLPARCAPITAGEFVAQAVIAMLNERGEGV